MHSCIDVAVDLFRNGVAFGRKFEEALAQFRIIDRRFAAALPQPFCLLAEIARTLPHLRNVGHGPPATDNASDGSFYQKCGVLSRVATRNPGNDSLPGSTDYNLNFPQGVMNG